MTIVEMTALNLHGEAIRAGLDHLQDCPDVSQAKKTIDLANREHERIGYLTPLLSHYRQMLYNFMMDRARSEMSSEQFKAFYSQF